MHPRQQMARTNEGTQQAVPIKVGAEIANPPTAEQIARFPIASRRLIEMWPDMVLVDIHVLARVGFGKEPVQGAVVQVPAFVNAGDMIRVDTRTGEYLERAK